MRADTVADRLCEASIGPSQGQLDDIMHIIEEVMDAYVDIDAFEQAANKRMAEEGYPIRFDRKDELLNTNHAPGRVGEDGMVLMPPQIFGLEVLRTVISHEGVHVFQMAAAARKGKAAEMFKSSHDRMVLPGGRYSREAYYTDKHEVMAHARTLIDRFRAARLNRRQALQQLRDDPNAGKVHREQRNRFLKNAYNYAQDLPESADPDDPDQFLKRVPNPASFVIVSTQRIPQDRIVPAGRDHYFGPGGAMGGWYPPLWSHKAHRFASLALANEMIDKLKKDGWTRRNYRDLTTVPSTLPPDITSIKQFRPLVEAADPDDVDPLKYALGSIDPLFAALSGLGFEYDADDRMSLRLPYQRLIHVYAKNQWSPKYIAELWFSGGWRTRTDKVERKNPASILQHVEQWIATYRGIAEATDPDAFDPQRYIDSTPLHRVGRPKLDEFTRSYAACALWSTNDNSDPETGGEPMDRNYDIDDIEDETLWDMVDDCANFRQQHAGLLEQSGLSDDRAGFCFWLSRCGHGSGFFDEGTEVDDELQAAAEAFGNVDLEVSDEGTIYAL